MMYNVTLPRINKFPLKFKFNFRRPKLRFVLAVGIVILLSVALFFKVFFLTVGILLSAGAIFYIKDLFKETRVLKLGDNNPDISLQEIVEDLEW